MADTPEQATNTPSVVSEPHSSSNYLSGKPVTPEQTQLLFSSLEDGLTLKQAAHAANMSRQTAWRLMRRYEGSLESASKYLATKALAVAEDWVVASEKAAEKGDHRPAKDLLQTIKAVEPIGDSGARAGVTIVIGTPEQPIRVQTPTIDIEPQ
jgi:hypothetical protein